MLHIATASRLPPLVSLELAQVEDVSGIIHAILELCRPSLHARVGDVPPLGVSEKGFEAFHVVLQLCDLTGDAQHHGHLFVRHVRD